MIQRLETLMRAVEELGPLKKLQRTGSQKSTKMAKRAAECAAGIVEAMLQIRMQKNTDIEPLRE